MTIRSKHNNLLNFFIYDKKVIKKIKEWLKLNIKHKPIETDLITDNENLLNAIEEWQKK